MRIINIICTFVYDFSSEDVHMQFSKEWQVMLFHYDGKVSEWNDFEWSRNAIHISTRKQAKWYVSFVLPSAFDAGVLELPVFLIVLCFFVCGFTDSSCYVVDQD